MSLRAIRALLARRSPISTIRALRKASLRAAIHSGLPQFIPTFSLLWVNMLHDYWMYVDDVALVKETLPHTRVRGSVYQTSVVFSSLFSMEDDRGISGLVG